MYHCHFEDVEHVQMGMTGMVFVRPVQNRGAGPAPATRLGGSTAAGAFMGYAYNDGDAPSDPRSTAYDREFAFMMTELWAEAHYRDAHIQATDWTDFDPELLADERPGLPGHSSARHEPDPRGRPGFDQRPVAALPADLLPGQANTGERVLLRLANLGYQNHAISVDGIDLTVVGKDAGLLRGRDGSSEYTVTNTVEIGPGESRDVIFTAPTVSSVSTYRLYDRNYAYLNNGGGTGYGGQMTEIRVSPAGTLKPQTRPNA